MTSKDLIPWIKEASIELREALCKALMVSEEVLPTYQRRQAAWGCVVTLSLEEDNQGLLEYATERIQQDAATRRDDY